MPSWKVHKAFVNAKLEPYLGFCTVNSLVSLLLCVISWKFTDTRLMIS